MNMYQGKENIQKRIRLLFSLGDTVTIPSEISSTGFRATGVICQITDNLIVVKKRNGLIESVHFSDAEKLAITKKAENKKDLSIEALIDTLFEGSGK